MLLAGAKQVMAADTCHLLELPDALSSSIMALLPPRDLVRFARCSRETLGLAPDAAATIASQLCLTENTLLLQHLSAFAATQPSDVVLAAKLKAVQDRHLCYDLDLLRQLAIQQATAAPTEPHVKAGGSPTPRPKAEGAWKPPHCRLPRNHGVLNLRAYFGEDVDCVPQQHSFAFDSPKQKTALIAECEDARAGGRVRVTNYRWL